jgi:hypothetical protein
MNRLRTRTCKRGTRAFRKGRAGAVGKGRAGASYMRRARAVGAGTTSKKNRRESWRKRILRSNGKKGSNKRSLVRS